MYYIDIGDGCQKDIDRLVKKNNTLKIALEKAIEKILANPEHFKPLRRPMQNTRRVHVLGSFVLVYEIEGNVVKLLSFDHHDDAYR